jgi:hypothetical protein
LNGRAWRRREIDASATAASLRDAVLPWQRLEFSVRGRSMTFWPVTGRQRPSRRRWFSWPTIFDSRRLAKHKPAHRRDGHLRQLYRSSSTGTSARLVRAA